MNGFKNLMQYPLIDVLGETLLHFLWQGALVAGLLAVALYLLRNATPNLRYALSTGAMGLLLLLPIATGVQVYLQGAKVNGQLSLVTGQESAVSVPHPETSIQQPASGNQLLTPQHTSNPELRTQNPQNRLRLWLLSWRTELVLAWLTGVVLLSLRLLTGLLTLHRLRKHALPMGESLLQGEAIERLFAALANRMGIKPAVALRTSTKIQQPLLIGWLKPMVLLPASLLGGLPMDQLEAILAHELAHVRRHDYLVLLGQSVMETLFFYHPAVWWISHHMRIEREYCCDVEAAQVSDKLVYAQALANLEAGRMKLALGAGDGRLVDRIRRLVSPEMAAGRLRTSWMTLAVLLIGSSVLLASCKKREDNRPADVIFHEANELARAGEFYAAEELAEIAAEKGDVCAMELLAGITYPDIKFYSPKKLVMLPPVKWSGQSERKSRKWTEIYVKALVEKAQAGNVDAMNILGYIYNEDSRSY